MSGLLIVMSIVILIAMYITISIYYENKRLKISKEKSQKRLKDEQAKPKSYIKVIVFDGEQLYTSKFEPEYKYYHMSMGDGYSILYTSRNLAEDYVHSSYKDGYFEFGNRSIPIRVVKEVEILSE